MASKCSSTVGHFNGHGGAPEQYRRHPQCGMPRATWAATESLHRATTCSVLPKRPPGQQQMTRQQKNGPTFLAILMAAAVRRYHTARIGQWRRSRALVEATKCRHWASIAADRCNWSCLPWFFFGVFNRQLVGKGRGLMLRPLFSIGVLHIK
jgi:hypothetical protein